MLIGGKCLNCIEDYQDIIIALADLLLNIFKRLKDSKNRWFNYINKNKLDKACFAHVAGYADSKHFAKGIVSDKVLKDRAYEIPLNSKYDRYRTVLASMVHKFFDKRTGSGAIATGKAGADLNEVLALKNYSNHWLKNSKEESQYEV